MAATVLVSADLEKLNGSCKSIVAMHPVHISLLELEYWHVCGAPYRTSVNSLADFGSFSTLGWRAVAAFAAAFQISCAPTPHELSWVCAPIKEIRSHSPPWVEIAAPQTRSNPLLA